MKQKITGRIVSIALTIAMLISAVPVLAAPEVTVFSDTQHHWAQASIARWEAEGIVQGDETGNFRPDAALKRGDLAVMLHALMGYPKAEQANPFTDLPPDQYYTGAVLALNEVGVLLGDGTSVRPDARISRQETAVVLARLLALEDGTVSAFRDTAQIAPWAAGAVAAMTEKGYLKGNNGAFRPTAPISRAEIMTILDRCFAGYTAESGIQLGDVDGNLLVKAAGVTVKDAVVSGDLIVAPGVGDGDVTLENVTVKGRLIVRGGGANSVRLTGTSGFERAIVCRRDGALRLAAATGVKTGPVLIAAGSQEVTLDGAFDTVTLEAAGSTLQVSGVVNHVEITAQAKAAALRAAAGSVVKKVENKADNVCITGAGRVDAVIVSDGDGVLVETGDTKITVAADAGTVKTPNGEIKSGQSGSTARPGGGGTSHVRVYIDTPEVLAGGAVTLTAEVSGLTDASVVWSVEGAQHADTVISENTLLISLFETAKTLTVRATSVQSPSLSGSAVVTVLPNSGKEGTQVSLALWRDAENVVTLQWDALENAVGYNVYDQPYGASQVKLNEKPLTYTRYVAETLSINKVHTLTVKAVMADDSEVGTENVKKVGITEKIDVVTSGVGTLEQNKDSLKLPVSDFAENLEYLGPTIQDDQYHYWCYSSVEDENGKMHLFMSRVPKAVPFRPGWKTTSEIVHFVADTPEGPFTEVGVPFGPDSLPDGQMSAHNPRIKKIDDKYVLLYIVRYNYDASIPDATKKEGYQKTCMAIIDELPTEAGTDTIDKWTLAAQDEKENGVILEYGIKAVNPDMFKVEGQGGEPDEYILCFKGNAKADKEEGPYHLFYATAENLMGPYTYQGKYTDSQTTIEDPSVYEWKDKYFMLTYDLGNGISGTSQSVGMLLSSRDPHFFSFADAQISAGLLNDYIKIPAGKTDAYSGSLRIERPYLNFVDGRPAYFIGTNSVDVNGNKVTQSYTFKIAELPQHKIIVDSEIKNGHITVSQETGEQYDDIFVTLTPDEGCVYVPDSLTITYNDAVGKRWNAKVETVDGKLCFMMPAGDATITAKFKSGQPGVVTGVAITPKSVSVLKGKTQNFTAAVTGTGDYSEAVTWTVTGGVAGTNISTTGVLTVDANETAGELTVRVAAQGTPEKFTEATVTLIDRPVNLALGLGEEAYLSSEHFNNGKLNNCRPQNAFDGVYSTDLPKIWTPKFYTNEWLGVHFKESTSFNTIILTERVNAGALLKSLDVQVSDDGITWSTVQSFIVADNNATGTRTQEFKLDQVAQGNYMRIANLVCFPRTDAGNPTFTHVMEMEIYNTDLPTW